jgi:cytochrome c2
MLAAAAGLLVLIVLATLGWEYLRERSHLHDHAAAITGGNPERGEALFIEYGCGSCHAVKNVRTATGMVGPPLDGVAHRTIIAGRVANTPANMQRWIRQPQHLSPGTAMPDLAVGEQDARDISAFLYTRDK